MFFKSLTLKQVFCKNIPKSLYCTDAVQAIGKVNCDFQELTPKTVIMSSHKIGGPKGVGAAF